MPSPEGMSWASGESTLAAVSVGLGGVGGGVGGAGGAAQGTVAAWAERTCVVTAFEIAVVFSRFALVRKESDPLWTTLKVPRLWKVARPGAGIGLPVKEFVEASASALASPTTPSFGL